MKRRSPWVKRTRAKLTQWDTQLVTLASGRRSIGADRVMRTASTMANRSMLWTGIAAGMAATGRRRPRTAAGSGMLGIGIAATLANGPLKFLWRRQRPSIVFTPERQPLLALPRTFSFPSGHSASAAAFATGVTIQMPAAGAALIPMAATVAYSRVYTGVHYPSDVVVGAAVGAASGMVAARVVSRMRESSVHRVDAPALDIAVPRSAILLTSEDAGSADGLDLAKKTLADAGVEISETVTIEEIERLTKLVRASDGTLVIAAGGDGTVCAATNAIAGADALLGIIPLGTSNDVARSLGIPPDPIEAAQVLADGQVCAVDVARVQAGDESRVFLNAATVGLNVAFARLATDSTLRDTFGGLTYPVAAARAVRRYEPFECTLDYDGQTKTIQAVHISVSNAPVFGGFLGMRVPDASLTDGLLDVIVAERLSFARTVLAVANALVGRHHAVHRVHTMHVRSIRIQAGGQDLALDGEVIATMPAEFEVEPGALRVVVPRPA